MGYVLYYRVSRGLGELRQGAGRGEGAAMQQQDEAYVAIGNPRLWQCDYYCWGLAGMNLCI